MKRFSISRWVVGSVAMSLAGCGGVGCIENQVDRLVDGLIGAIEDADGSDAVDPTSPARDDIQDGTPNTIGVGEQPSGGSGGGGTPPGGGGSTPPIGGGGTPPPVGGGAAEAIAEFTRGLGDKFITFGSSSFFSSGSITDSVQLQTCAFGRFGMLVTRVTSTSFNTFSSEETLLGTWSVKAVGGGFVLELNVDQATDAGDIGVQQRVLTVDSNGNLFIDNERAEVADAAADCAAAQRQG